MLAGPSEVLVIADATANVDTVAADLLAQVNIYFFFSANCAADMLRRPVGWGVSLVTYVSSTHAFVFELFGLWSLSQDVDQFVVVTLVCLRFRTARLIGRERLHSVRGRGPLSLSGCSEFPRVFAPPFFFF